MSQECLQLIFQSFEGAPWSDVQPSDHIILLALAESMYVERSGVLYPITVRCGAGGIPRDSLRARQLYLEKHGYQNTSILSTLEGYEMA
jgi:hypothetical protein